MVVVVEGEGGVHRFGRLKLAVRERRMGRDHAGEDW